MKSGRNHVSCNKQICSIHPQRVPYLTLVTEAYLRNKLVHVIRRY